MMMEQQTILQPHIEKMDIWRYQLIADNCQGSVLDIACGLKGIQKLLSTPYIGIDLNGGDVIASAYNLPFPDLFVSTVVLGEVLEHLGKPIVALSEAARVAQNRIVITVPNDYSLVRLARLALGREVENQKEHILSYNSWNIKQMLATLDFTVTEYFNFPLRLQLLPEIPIKSRFGYWLFVIADRNPVKT